MNRREQTLALALGTILLLGGFAFGFVKLNAWKKEIERRDYSMMQDRVRAEELLQQKEYWMTRSDWLAKKQPVFIKRADANNELLDIVTKTAKEAGVSAGPPQPQQLDERLGLKAAGVTVNATGELEQILRWLYKLQQSPEAFISIEGMTLKPDQEDLKKVMVNDLHVKKWYRDGGAASKPATSESQ